MENLALRQQLAIFKRQSSRPRLGVADKLFWVTLRRFWSSWKKTLIVVSPDTVVRWHRAGFGLYWRLISRRQPVGRRPVTKQIRELILRMTAENPTWRAPRIHGELLMLGFDISERSVSRWMRRVSAPADPTQRWLTFLRNHREAIAAIGRVEDWRHCPVGSAYPLLPVSVGVPQYPNREPGSSPRHFAPSVRISRTGRSCLLLVQVWTPGLPLHVPFDLVGIHTILIESQLRRSAPGSA